MRILLASKRPPGIKRDGGVQTWTLTMASALEQLGHDVTIWGPCQPLSQYDLGIFAHLSHTRAALPWCSRSILVSHGIVPAESPESGCDVTAFTSEEVRDHWNGDGPIIRQPIDLKFWTPGKVGNALVRYAARRGLSFAPSVAKALDLPFIHASGQSQHRAREIVRGASCVLATGRAALEAMACNVPAVICDDRHYQGPLIGCGDLETSMKHNYSGRCGVKATPDNVRKAISEAKPNREWVDRHHDSMNVAKEILCLAS